MSYSKKKDFTKNNKELYIEYHFLHTLNNYSYNTKIPILKIQNIFLELSKRFGENNHKINEYSLYIHDEMELIIYMDGSNFCKKTKTRKINDPYIKDDNIITLYVEKNKMHNDTFPSLYNNSVYDIIDIVFSIDNNIQCIIRTNMVYENNKKDTIDKIGISKNHKSNKNTWCEIFLQVDCSSDVNQVHTEIDYIKSLL